MHYLDTKIKINNIEEKDMARLREEIIGKPVDVSLISDIATPLSFIEKLYNLEWLRKTFFLIIMLAIWEIYARFLGNDLLFPTLQSTMSTWFNLIGDGTLIVKAGVSFKSILIANAIAIPLAFILVILATLSKPLRDVVELFSSIMSTIPAVAIIPLAMVWFGFTTITITFVLVNAVLWNMTMTINTGFQSVPETLRMVGRNYELSGFAYARHILIPAAFSSVLNAVKIGWGYSWRTLIAVELVMGAASGSGGVGYFISESKNNLDLPGVFAGLITVIIIGLFVEFVVFRTVENRTVRKWGVQS
jgi:NitT/TauT family transport system permease protein